MTAISVVLLVTCTKDEPHRGAAAAAAAHRGGANEGDGDLRAMVGELASARACALLRGQLRELRAPDRSGAVTGALWIRACEVDGDGAQVTFRVRGSGWQWTARPAMREGGAAPALPQYVRFGVEVRIAGVLDLAYARADHVATVGFTPAAPPEVAFAAIGEVGVDRERARAAVLDALASALPGAPGRTPRLDPHNAGRVAATIDLCTGLARPAPGAAAAPAPTTAELRPGGLLVAGPQLATGGLTVDVEATHGAVRVELVCADHAAELAEQFLRGAPRGEPPTVPSLASADVYATGRLRVASARCPVVIVARPLAGDPAAEPVATFTWTRPAAEIARSTGGALIRCAQ